MTSQHTKNILKVFALATQKEVQKGMSWYDVAKQDAIEISEFFEVPLSTVVGVMAGLSPNNRWYMNVKNARDMVFAFTNGGSVESCKPSTYKTMRDKAWSILEDVLVKDKEILERLNGQKIRSFYSNIMGLDEVTIDGHAYNIARNLRVELTDNSTSIGKRLYKELQGSYINAAKKEGIEPRQMQAITWVTWKRIHNV